MTKHRDPIIDLCAPATMFARLRALGVGRLESTIFTEAILLPVNFALVQEHGAQEWGCLMKEAAAVVRPGYEPLYTLASPRNPAQRQRRRDVMSRNWLVLIEVKTP